MWHLGEVLYKSVKREDEINVNVFSIKDNGDVMYSNDEYIGNSTKLNYSKMINNICSYTPRTKAVADIIISVDPNKKILVLSDRIQHLKELKEIVEGKKTCGIYIGGMNSKTMTNFDNVQVIFATYAIASEGYDQKNLNTLILASPKSDVIQSVGRVLRDKPEDRKYTPQVIDIVDKFSIFEKQWYKRRKYYKDQNYTIIKNDIDI
jgi:superfamily II DNA or RNA helicase